MIVTVWAGVLASGMRWSLSYQRDEPFNEVRASEAVPLKRLAPVDPAHAAAQLALPSGPDARPLAVVAGQPDNGSPDVSMR